MLALKVREAVPVYIKLLLDEVPFVIAPFTRILAVPVSVRIRDVAPEVVKANPLNARVVPTPVAVII